MHKGSSKSREKVESMKYPERISITLDRIDNSNNTSRRSSPFKFTDTNNDHAIAMVGSDTDPESGESEENSEEVEWERLRSQVKKSNGGEKNKSKNVETKTPINLYKEKYEVPKKVSTQQSKHEKVDSHILPIPESKPRLSMMMEKGKENVRQKEKERNNDKDGTFKHAVHPHSEREILIKDSQTSKDQINKDYIRSFTYSNDSSFKPATPKSPEQDRPEINMTKNEHQLILDNLKLTSPKKKQENNSIDIDSDGKNRIRDYTISVESLIEDMRQMIIQKTIKINQLQSLLKSLNVKNYPYSVIDDGPVLKLVDPVLRESEEIRLLMNSLVSKTIPKYPTIVSPPSLPPAQLSQPIIVQPEPQLTHNINNKLISGLFDYFTSKLLNSESPGSQEVLEELKKAGHSDRLKMLDRVLQMYLHKNNTLSEIYHDKFLSENIVISLMQKLITRLGDYINDPTPEKLKRLSQTNLRSLQEELQRIKDSNEKAIIETGGIPEVLEEHSEQESHSESPNQHPKVDQEDIVDEESSALDRLDKMRREGTLNSNNDRESEGLSRGLLSKSEPPLVKSPRNSLDSKKSFVPPETEKDLVRILMTQARVLEQYKE